MGLLALGSLRSEDVGGFISRAIFRIRYVAAMSVADWSASASGEKEPRQRWLGFLIHAFGSCQNHLRWTWISRSDQARDGASFSRQNEHSREERKLPSDSKKSAPSHPAA